MDQPSSVQLHRLPTRTAGVQEPWLGSKDSPPTVDLTANPSQLRWVGDEFVYFPDIPWLDGQQNVTGAWCSIPLRDLTIGVLEDIMNRSISTDLMLSQSTSGDNHDVVLSGSQLTRLIVHWARYLRSLGHVDDRVQFEQWGVHVREIMAKAISLIEVNIFPKIKSLADHHAPDAQLLSTLLTFFVSLAKCTHAIWKDREVVAMLEQRSQMYREAVDVFMAGLKETWGEKQYRVATCHLGGGFPFLAYTLQCAPTANKATTIDSATYQSQHCTPSCVCAFIKPSITRVQEILANHQVPVVVLEGDELVVRTASAGPYIAISHVWADGLGSTAEAGLPRCQVERLAELTRQLMPDGAFWLDALCVPGAFDFRRGAITLMAQTYERADKVLVIDGGIRTQCSLSSPKEECLLRIATSGWMQRIWTVPEAMLARELVFEVADGIMDCSFFDGEAYRIAKALVPMLAHRPHDDVARRYLRRSGSALRCTIDDLIALLRNRSTSVAEDEPLAIAGLLGVDAGRLMELPTVQERMKALLIETRVLPRQLGVHGWFCDRLSLPNFTWAPTSLKEVLWPGDPDDPLVATCTEEGLVADYYVIRFPPVTLRVNIGIVAVVDASKSRVLNLILSPYLFRMRKIQSVVVSGIVMKRALDTEKLRDEGVAVVDVDVSVSSDEGAPLRCKFVASGSASAGYPSVVETTRSRTYWAHVQATEEPLRSVCLT